MRPAGRTRVARRPGSRRRARRAPSGVPAQLRARDGVHARRDRLRPGRAAASTGASGATGCHRASGPSPCRAAQATSASSCGMPGPSVPHQVQLAAQRDHVGRLRAVPIHQLPRRRRATRPVSRASRSVSRARASAGRRAHEGQLRGPGGGSPRRPAWCLDGVLRHHAVRRVLAARDARQAVHPRAAPCARGSPPRCRRYPATRPAAAGPV